jgi:hypothetical protein
MAELQVCGPDCDECRGYNEWLAALREPRDVAELADWVRFSAAARQHVDQKRTDREAAHDRASKVAVTLTERGHRDGWLPPGAYFEYGPVAVGERGQPATALPFDEPHGRRS